MKVLSVIITLFLTTSIFSQEQRKMEITLKEKVSERMDSYFLKLANKRYIKQNKALQEFGFSNLQNIDAEFVFRYCTNNSIIEVVEDKGVFKGTVFFFVYGVQENGIKEAYTTKKILSVEVCQEIKKSFDNDANRILYDKHKYDLKKISYRTFFQSSIEFIKDDNYIFQLFPSSSRRVNYEKDRLDVFLEKVLALSNYNEIRTKFNRENPYHHYLFWNGYGVYTTH
ncbi:hypothetical protein [uncultured Dokdonia sp.]|uniref:hypothetical protein n=1 Tax=uncultured Dokdonia sp. TaxID=575653 RepID=UPI00262D777D|nr:hypothetical protein [uncultured Dokdonia sp.]